jgi:hypothetical protein
MRQFARQIARMQMKPMRGDVADVKKWGYHLYIFSIDSQDSDKLEEEHLCRVEVAQGHQEAEECAAVSQLVEHGAEASAN